eukprot:59043-Amphidinium_carterae.1
MHNLPGVIRVDACINGAKGAATRCSTGEGKRHCTLLHCVSWFPLKNWFVSSKNHAWPEVNEVFKGADFLHFWRGMGTQCDNTTHARPAPDRELRYIRLSELL